MKGLTGHYDGPRIRLLGNLDFRGATFRRLPDGMDVEGDLDVSFSALTELPAGLRVGGTLRLQGTRIKEIPADLVAGKLDARKSAL